MSETTIKQQGDEEFFSFLESDETAAKLEKWKILIVDDEPEVHRVTRLALDGFVYDERELELTSAYSGEEAKNILDQDADFAMAFVDVVMESDDAGLQLVRYIRETLKNTHLRIILRTGQPGVAPEQFVIENYDIDDYKAKTEMTAQKLITSVVGSLRAYKEIKRIEQIVETRTAEIREKNQELLVLNRDLTDSIVYARRIQEAILPLEQLVNSQIPRFTILYEPKDIVSGDFYWFFNRGEDIYFAVVDCTGHGVPGAFMAVLGYSLLNQVISMTKTSEPDDILTQLDLLLRNALRRDSRMVIHNHDGMDLGLCVFNTRTMQLKFAGARRPLYIYRGDNLTIVPGTRISIGSIEMAKFEAYQMQLQKGDVCYIFTDGVTDQFGGPDNRKMFPRRFKQMLSKIVESDFEQHQELLKNYLLKWRGDNPQTDDILVMGMQVL